MHAQALIDRLERFPAALAAAARCARGDDVRWRPAHGGWSIVEIVNHLADEDVEDFRARLAATLRDPDAAWPPIDPEGAVVARRHNERDLDESLERFGAARRESVSWLRSLKRPDWDASHAHPTLGAIRAGDLLTAWCAHDALHLRQIARRLHELALRDAEGFDASYAGAW